MPVNSWIAWKDCRFFGCGIRMLPERWIRMLPESDGQQLWIKSIVPIFHNKAATLKTTARINANSNIFFYIYVSKFFIFIFLYFEIFYFLFFIFIFLYFLYFDILYFYIFILSYFHIFIFPCFFIFIFLKFLYLYIRLSKKSWGISASLSLQARSSSCIRRIGSR